MSSQTFSFKKIRHQFYALLILCTFFPYDSMALIIDPPCWENQNYLLTVLDGAVIVGWEGNPDTTANQYKIVYFDCEDNGYEILIETNETEINYALWGPLCIADLYVYAMCDSAENGHNIAGDPSTTPFEHDIGGNPQVVVIDDPGQVDSTFFQNAYPNLLWGDQDTYSIDTLPDKDPPPPFPPGGIIFYAKTNSSNINDNGIHFYPNPIQSTSTIHLNLAQASVSTSVYIVNTSGQVIEQIINQQALEKGQHTFLWRTYAIPEGLYFCVVKTSTQTYSIPIQKL